MSKWIACKDELPDDEITVMTFEADSCEPIWPGWHDSEKGWMDITGVPIPSVTHWMPFPDPPEE